VTAALAQLALELELLGWAPWRLLERGTEWILEPKSELVALLSGVRWLPVTEAKILSEEHKAVLLVVIGHRGRSGVSTAVIAITGTLPPPSDPAAILNATKEVGWGTGN
jgi:hypothetical protein